MLVYLVRHLATELSGTGIYMGRSRDLPILKSTIPAFRERLERLFPRGLEETVLVFSSPSRRCFQTAEILTDALGTDRSVTVTTEFCETDYGDFEGKHLREIKETYPDLYSAWISTPSRVTFPRGESFRDVQERSFAKLLELLREHSEKVEASLIVTHVDVIKMIVSKVLSIPIDKKPYFYIHYGSFSCLEVEGEKIRVKYLNRT